MTGQNKVENFIFRCTTEMRDRAKAKAARHGISLAEVIRVALQRYIDGKLEKDADRAQNAGVEVRQQEGVG